MSKLSDVLSQVSNIKVEKPDNPYTNISNTTVPLSDIISIQGVITRHEEDTKAKDAEILRLKEQVSQSSDAEEATKQMQEDLKLLNEKLAVMTEKLESKGSDIDTEDYKKLKAEFDELQKSFDELKSEKDVLIAEKDTLTTEKNDLQTKYDESITASESKEKELSGSVEKLTAEVNEVKAENEKVVTQNKEYETEVTSLKAEIENLKSKSTADVELTAEYIRDHGFYYTDLLDGKLRGFFGELAKAICPPDELSAKNKGGKDIVKAYIHENLGRTIFVTDDDHQSIIISNEFYAGKYTASEIFNVMIDVVCKCYTGSELEEFVFKPFAVQYGFDTMLELVEYLKNKGTIIEVESTETDTTDTVVTDNTDNANADTGNEDTTEVYVDDTDNADNIKPVGVVLDGDYIQQLVYDAVYQCFNDNEFDTNMYYMSKLISFACACALHVTPFSCKSYFKTYDDKRNAAILADMMEFTLREIFRAKIERIKPPIDGDPDPETERAMGLMEELNAKVNEMIDDDDDDFFECDLGDFADDDFNAGANG